MTLKGKMMLGMAMAAALLAGSVMAEDAVPLATPSALARVAKKVTPDFPTAAKQLNLNGTQDVEVTVSATGDVESAKVLKGNAIFSNSSLAAVKQWKFNPLVKDGQPVRFTTVLSINYQR